MLKTGEFVLELSKPWPHAGEPEGAEIRVGKSPMMVEEVRYFQREAWLILLCEDGNRDYLPARAVKWMRM